MDSSSPREGEVLSDLSDDESEQEYDPNPQLNKVGRKSISQRHEATTNLEKEIGTKRTLDIVVKKEP